jgi:hypothetical protein
VEDTPPLYAQPPETSEVPTLPLQALAEGLQVVLTDLRILWVFVGVGQGYGDEPSLGGPEGTPVDASETSQEISAACPGEASYPSPDSSSVIRMRSSPGFYTVILEGECGTDPPTEEET